MQFIDDVMITDAPRETGDGYLVADVRVARTGIQFYLGSEVGMPDKRVVAVYRPPEQVFATDSMMSYAHRPVTMDHPEKAVTADTWASVAKGTVGAEVVRDGEFVRVPMLVMDAAAIKAIKDGKNQISAGYNCKLVKEAGKTPEGVQYDAFQTDIRINHFAIVKHGRAGEDVRIGDSWGVAPMHVQDHNEVTEMTTAPTLVNIAVKDRAFQTTPEGAEAVNLLKKDVETLTADVASLVAKQTEAINAKDEEIGGLKAEIQKLKDSQVKPADLDKLVKDRAALVKTAEVLLPGVVLDGMSDSDIRKKAVAVKLGDAAVTGVSDAEISGMFRVLSTNDGLKGVTVGAPIVSPSNPTAIVTDQAVNDARAKMIADLTN